MCIAMQELCKDWMAEGIAKGRTESAMETASKMLASGKLAVEEIAEYSGLSLEKVKELAREKAAL